MVAAALSLAPSPVRLAAVPALAAVEDAAPYSDLELSMLARVNEARAAHGMAPVRLDTRTLPIARQRARTQLTHDYLTHEDETGQLAIVPLLAQARATYRLAGENLAAADGIDTATVDRTFQALMDSPTHRANVLEASFTHLAVGVAMDALENVVFAQVFRATANP